MHSGIIEGVLRGRELRYALDAVVVLAGIPGAGKSTFLRRVFTGGEPVRVFDSAQVRDRWRPVLGVLPYALWRPLVHLVYYVTLLAAMRRGQGPMVVHDCATRPWARRLIGWRARQAGLPLHLILLDVPGDVARSGQWARGRVVRSASMEKHCRRWPGLAARAVDDPGSVVPGAASAIVLTRRQADQVGRISFGCGNVGGT
ncbi:AAA family ATPase [Kribbella solani]|uniref:Putative kinase n=1 Tax=Kribbella solani TaxID=236067 RepID=A0A841DSQ5_9ACTN|nr:putative kinase [Kribbella solani]